MGGNQSTISYDKHNLWLIDDRLSFHRYIYSDTKIKKQLLPRSDRFSVTNIKYAKRWYEFYNQNDVIRQRVVDELHIPADFGLVP